MIIEIQLVHAPHYDRNQTNEIEHGVYVRKAELTAAMHTSGRRFESSKLSHVHLWTCFQFFPSHIRLLAFQSMQFIHDDALNVYISIDDI